MPARDATGSINDAHELAVSATKARGRSPGSDSQMPGLACIINVDEMDAASTAVPSLTAICLCLLLHCGPFV